MAYPLRRYAVKELSLEFARLCLRDQDCFRSEKGVGGAASPAYRASRGGRRSTIRMSHMIRRCNREFAEQMAIHSR